jgi:hypothetical protein
MNRLNQIAAMLDSCSETLRERSVKSFEFFSAIGRQEFLEHAVADPQR